MPKVLVTEGPLTGRTFDLVPGQNIIGRGDDAHITLASGQVSRRHASLTMAEGRIYVEDMGSSNGTYVNGAKVQRVEIRPGNKIRIGEFGLEVVPDGGRPAPAAPAPEAPDAGKKRARSGGKGAEPAPGGGKAPRQRGDGPAAGGASGAMLRPAVAAPEGRFWKLYAPLRVVPWQVQITLVLALVGALIVTGVVGPMLTHTEKAVSAEALKRAETLVNSLAMRNGEFIKTSNDIYYDTKTFLSNEGVTEAYLLSRDLVILSPPEQRNRVKRNALTNQVQNSKDIVSLEEASIDADGRKGTYHLASPIRVWNADAGRYDIYGYAYLVFQADLVGKAATGRASRMVLYGGIIGGLLLAAMILITVLTVRPLTALRDDAEYALRGDSRQVVSRARFRALQDVAHTLNRAIERAREAAANAGDGMGSAMPVPQMMPQQAMPMMPTGGGGGDDALGDKKVEAIANALPQGVIILDDMQRVVFVNARVDAYIGRSARGSEGRHVMEIVSDPQLLGTILDLFKQIMSSPGSVASLPVNVGGRGINVVVSGVLGEARELKYAAVVIG